MLTENVYPYNNSVEIIVAIRLELFITFVCLLHALSVRNKVNQQIEQVASNTFIFRSGEKANIAAPVRSIIDLNTADESALASLSGVGLILAKKAVKVRQERGGFRSISEFYDLLGLQPHIRVKLRPLVTISDPAPPASPAEQQPEYGGRVVDY
jgi:hypothetical protein